MPGNPSQVKLAPDPALPMALAAPATARVIRIRSDRVELADGESHMEQVLLEKQHLKADRSALGI